MTTAGLPFTLERTNQEHQHDERCGLRAFMSPALQRACDASPQLSDYLHCLPFTEIGVPQFYPKLSRDLQKLENKNLIYPIGDGLFVHVYPDKLGARDYYVSIEPGLTIDLGDLIHQIEQRLLDYADRVGAAADDDEKRRILLEVLDEICTTDSYEESPRIYVTPKQFSAIRYLMVRDKVGMGRLQPLLHDPYIEDISCSGVGPVFVEHKVFRSLQSSLVFTDHEEVDDFVVLLGEWIRRPVTVRNPIVDAVLPDGSRINIVYGREITTRGSNFTIRKFSDTPLSVLDLIEFGTLDYRIEKEESAPLPVRTLLEGGETGTNLTGGRLRVSLTLEPGERRLLRTVYPTRYARSSNDTSFKRKLRTRARRYLSEMRDNYISRNAFLLSFATRLKNRLLQ